MKSDFARRIPFVLMIAFVMTAFVFVPAFAQAGNPPPAVPSATPVVDPGQPGDSGDPLQAAKDFAAVAVDLIGALAAIGALGERFVELGKIFLRRLAELANVKALAVEGWKSIVLALLVSVAAVIVPGFKFEFLQKFALFANVSPGAVAFLNVFVLALVQFAIHNSHAFDWLYKAPPVASLKFNVAAPKSAAPPKS